MIISHEKKFVFVHVPKTAGTSITHTLKNYASYSVSSEYKIAGKRILHKSLKKHAHAKEIRKYMKKDQWREYFKFAFVRNPWDLFVSLYFWLKNHSPHSKIRQKNILFKQFITNFYHNQDKAVLMGQGQKPFIFDARKCLVDYVGKYETLESDVGAISSRLGVSLSLPHIFKTDHKKYKKYYNSRTHDMIAKVCAEDIRIFNYSF